MEKVMPSMKASNPSKAPIKEPIGPCLSLGSFRSLLRMNQAPVSAAITPLINTNRNKTQDGKEVIKDAIFQKFDRRLYCLALPYDLSFSIISITSLSGRLVTLN